MLESGEEDEIELAELDHEEIKQEFIEEIDLEDVEHSTDNDAQLTHKELYEKYGITPLPNQSDDLADQSQGKYKIYSCHLCPRTFPKKKSWLSVSYNYYFY